MVSSDVELWSGGIASSEQKAENHINVQKTVSEIGESPKWSVAWRLRLIFGAAAVIWFAIVGLAVWLL
jgi:hypothetical protein